MQAKPLLPASMIQTIIECYRQMHDLDQSHQFYELQEKLQNVGIEETDVSNVIESFKCEDLFRKYNT